MLQPIRKLEDEYERAREAHDDRMAADLVYALTVRVMEIGDYDGACRSKA
jgi:hypothetical protein